MPKKYRNNKNTRKNKRGGSCSSGTNMNVPCDMRVNTDQYTLSCSRPSQSDLAFESRFSIGKYTTTGTEKLASYTQPATKIVDANVPASPPTVSSEPMTQGTLIPDILNNQINVAYKGTGGRRTSRSKSKRSKNKRNSKNKRKSKNRNSKRGGAYYLNVAGDKALNPTKLAGDPLKNSIGGLAEVANVFDYNAPKYAPNCGTKFMKPAYLDNLPKGAVKVDTQAARANQFGGAFEYIVNPKTKRKVKVNGKIGKQVLRKYLKQLGGDYVNTGAPSNFDPNMINRKFGCRQPEWKPSCV